MAITYLKKSPKTSSTDDTKTKTPRFFSKCDIETHDFLKDNIG